MICLRNGKILKDSQLINDDLWIEKKSGKIIDPMTRFYQAISSRELDAEIEYVDCKGKIISPGFIELQFNGGYGVDFSNLDHMADPNNILKCAKALLATGVTSFCPTLISIPEDHYRKLFPLFPETDGSITGGASMIGLHTEGPYFSPPKRGAHCIDNLRVPAQHPVSQVYGRDHYENVRIVTLAPELPGALDAIREILHDMPQPKRGRRVVSMGHSSACFDEAEAGVRAGITKITHLFNAMGAFHHRDPAIVGILGCPEYRDVVSYGIIADGLHAHSSSVAMAYESHPKGCVLVTDAMTALGLPDGIHSLGGQEVEVKPANLGYVQGRKAVLAGTDTLAGAIISMDECVRNLIKFTGCSVPEALDAATIHPARLIGLDDIKGQLQFGSDGDVVVLDEKSLSVCATYIKGKRLYVNSTK